MSRQLQRKSANASSLIGLKRHQKFCLCGAPGGACYDAQGDFVTYMCQEHKRENGYCIECGETLTSQEKTDPLGLCSKHYNWEAPF